MNLAELKNKRVGIIGYGREGSSVAQYLNQHGITPVLFDERSFSELPEELREEIKKHGWTWNGGPEYLNNLKAHADIIFRSPGVWRLHDALQQFTAAGGVLTSQVKYFFEHCPAPIIGVTGTKGKGTTTTLIYEMAVAAKKEAYLTGNIGKIEPLSFLENLHGSEVVCYELSSFQLQDLTKSPHIGVALMTTADHLDVHGSLDEYHSAKRAIVAFQSKKDFAILNKDYPASVEIGTQGEGIKFVFSSTPLTREEKGIQIENETLIAHGLDEFAIADGPLISLNDLTLRGVHNLQNVAAAILAGACAGFKLDSMLETVKNFKGLEHRLEFVVEKRGISFYNDSFSTAADPAIAAIHSFTEPLYVILGGSDKHLDYTELARAIAGQKNIAGLFVIGAIGPQIKKALECAGVAQEKIITSAPTLEAIFEQIHFLVQPGSVVLLSPATASFDMFPNYKVRGETFKQLALTW